MLFLFLLLAFRVWLLSRQQSVQARALWITSERVARLER